MAHKIFEYKGKKYIRKKSEDLCVGCAFEKQEYCLGMHELDMKQDPSCISKHNKHGYIFIEIKTKRKDKS